MQELQKAFNGQQLRMIHREDDVLFLLKDICSILEIGNARHVKNRLDEDVVSNYPLQTSGGNQIAVFINEDGLYDVVLDSRKPEAKRFRKWITSEVLPSIRKTGSYQVEQPKSQLEVLQGAINQMVAQEQRLSVVEKKQDTINELLALHPNDWRKKVNRIINQIAQSCDGAYQEIRKESYQLLEDRAKCQLSIRLTNRKRKMALEGAGKSKVDKTNKMDVIESDSRLTEIYLAVVKEMAVRNGIDLKAA